MPVVVLFIIFVVLLVIAVPVSITLGITSVLPSVFDPSFTVGAKYLIRAMFGGLTPSRSWQFQCLSFPVSSWPRAVFPKSCLMFLPIFLANSLLVCHVP